MVNRLAKIVSLILIRGYQLFIYPLLAVFWGSELCRFYPSCSEYSCECIKKHGVIKGVLLGGGRILRCHPFNNGGIDEIPEKFTLRRILKVSDKT